MGIKCDTREKHIDDIKEILLDLPEDIAKICPEFEFECLGTDKGDYLLTNGDHELAIERKSISDFCGSYFGLKDRLHTMRLHYSNVGLLLENPYTVANDMIYVLENGKPVPRMSYRTFSRFITHQNSLNTWIFYSMNFRESIYQLIYIWEYLPKLDHPEPSLKCGNIAELLIQLPGIGPKSISKLKEKYESPLDAINNGLSKKAKDLLSTW